MCTVNLDTYIVGKFKLLVRMLRQVKHRLAFSRCASALRGTLPSVGHAEELQMLLLLTASLNMQFSGMKWHLLSPLCFCAISC